MSEQDRLVLKNMMERKYRTYAVRGHESIDDIIEARQLTLSEVEALNPGTDLDDLKPREIIKLPAHKYSAHEEYEMQGSLGSSQTFHLGSLLMNSLFAGVAPSRLCDAMWSISESSCSISCLAWGAVACTLILQDQKGCSRWCSWTSSRLKQNWQCQGLDSSMQNLTVVIPGAFQSKTLPCSAVSIVISMYSFWLYKQSKKAKAAAALEQKIAASRKKYEVPDGLPLPSYMASMDDQEGSEGQEKAPE